MRKRISLGEHFTYGKLIRFALPSVVMMIYGSGRSFCVQLCGEKRLCVPELGVAFSAAHQRRRLYGRLRGKRFGSFAFGGEKAGKGQSGLFHADSVSGFFRSCDLCHKLSFYAADFCFSGSRPDSH